MIHKWENIDGAFGCSRCGQRSPIDTDERCPAVSDGEMYKAHPRFCLPAGIKLASANPPMPQIEYEFVPCPTCGAITQTQAEDGRCKSTQDQTGEYYCIGNFDADGFSTQPTKESLARMNAWIQHHVDVAESEAALPGSGLK